MVLGLAHVTGWSLAEILEFSGRELQAWNDSWRAIVKNSG